MGLRQRLEELRSYWADSRSEFVGLRQKRGKYNRDYDPKAAFGLRRRGRKRYKLKTQY